MQQVKQTSYYEILSLIVLRKRTSTLCQRNMVGLYVWVIVNR